MHIGIIGAMDEEIELIKQRIEGLTEDQYLGYTFYNGVYGQHTVSLVKSGIGKVNAAIVTTLLLGHYPVDFVVNTGTAGAISGDLEIGDVVIGSEVTFHDVDVTAFGYEQGQMAGMPVLYHSQDELINLAEASIRNNQVHKGMIVTGDEFVSNLERIKEIQHNYPLALVCEMESAAIAQTAYAFDIPCLIIRSVSDTADDEASIDFDEFVHLASRQSAGFLLQFIESI